MDATVYLNGDYVAESAARVPITDRGFLLGDGVFETLRAVRGEPVLWEAHRARLLRGLDVLRIPAPAGLEGLRSVVGTLSSRNGLESAVVRITVSRGTGPRGYSPSGAGPSTLLVTAHPAPPAFGDPSPGTGFRLVTSTHRLPAADALSRVKHASRALWVLARMEADAAGVDEALMLDPDGHVAEASSSNVAWWEGAELRTPGPGSGALPGVMLEAVLEAHRQQGGVCRESQVTPGELLRAGGIFLTNSVRLLVPVTELDGHPVPGNPRTAHLQAFLKARGFC